MNISELSDEQLVEHIRNGNPESYREVIARYQDRLTRYANSIAKDEAESLDIVQNSLIKAYINLNGFNVKKKFSSWLYRIVHNEALNEIRKRKHLTELPDDFELPSEEDITENLTRSELQAMVTRCMNGIPLLFSEPLSLYYLDGKSYEEISDILRIPISTVGTRISRAKALMKKICQTTKQQA